LPVTLSVDLAFMGQAALALYEATGKPDYLAYAETCAAQLEDGFLDTERGGYLANAHDEAANVLVNNRPLQDNAMPSANAAILDLLAGLAVATGKPDYATKAQDLFTALAGHLAKTYPSMAALLGAHQKLTHPLSIIIIGDSDKAAALTRTARQHAIFTAHIIQIAPDAPLPPAHPAFGKTLIDGAPAAYICPGQSCLAPIIDTDSLTAALDDLMQARHSSKI
jgi:uncharacterized protein YyaL (SSP411 family)